MDKRLYLEVAAKTEALEVAMREALDTPPWAGGRFAPQCDAYGKARRDFLQILAEALADKHRAIIAQTIDAS